MVGYEGYYMISTWGRVKSLDRDVPMQDLASRKFGGLSKQKRTYRVKGRILKAKVTKYHSVWFRGQDRIEKEMLVHRLVLEAFVGPCPEGMECCHGDGNGCNNRLENLRWDTPRNNHRDKRTHGTTAFGVKGNTWKLTRKIGAINQLRKSGYTLQQLASMFEVETGTIWYHLRKLKKPNLR